MGEIKAKTHIEKLGFSDSDKKKSKHDKIQTWVYNNIDKVIAETISKETDKPYVIKKVKWEHQIVYESTNKTYKSVVGFVDILVIVSGEFYDHKENVVFNEEREIFIEVKTEIPSLGELIRQMRAYQSYGSWNTRYLIVSPDDSHAIMLNKQGFMFYKYKDPTELF